MDSRDVFGYQGFNNSKFGRIEVHESINAFGREVLLDAKQTLESAGWHVLHGIVDSLWVTPRDADHAPIREVCAASPMPKTSNWSTRTTSSGWRSFL